MIDHKEKEVKITAQNVDFFYGQKQALKDISLDINKNEVFALIGPSGCGKTTFLRILNRMNDLIPKTKVSGRYELKVKIFMIRKSMRCSYENQSAPSFKNRTHFQSVFSKTLPMDQKQTEIKTRKN